MNNMRRHKRYYLELNDVKGKMSLSDNVEILDIGLSGVAFKAGRRLNPGREYTIKLQDKGKTLNAAGIIVRSELKGIEARDDGESVSIYAVGMQFKDGSADQVADFLKSIVQKRKETAPLPAERRLNVRFQIADLNENILSYPANFNVKTISLCGMLIQTDQALGIESKVPMELSLNDDTSVNFIGRIVSCHIKENKEQTYYDIGLEFTDLTDKDKTLFQTFIDQWATMKNGVAREREQSEGRT
jgi:PilZ domain